MTAEQSFIIQVLADFLNKRKTAVPDGLDFAEICRICREQQIDGILYSQIKGTDKLSADTATHLERSLAATFYYGMNRTSMLSKIDKAFNEQNLPYIIFKGTEISKYYPNPFLRSMGDSDMLVHKEDLERADKILINLGMKNDFHGANEWVYHYGDMEYELHCRMMNENEAGNCDSHREFMNKHWDYAANESGKAQYHLDDSFHFVFVIMHLRKHFVNCGVGFRQFMDVAVMAQKCRLNWEWVNEQLKALQLKEFADKCFSLCHAWFETPFGFETENDAEFIEQASISVMKNGVFGFNNEENLDNYVKLQMNKEKNFKIKNFFATFFPSYNKLRQTPDYEFLDGKPLILPFVWIYRFFHSLKKGRAAGGLNAATKAFKVSDDGLKKRSDDLKKWGL